MWSSSLAAWNVGDCSGIVLAACHASAIHAVAPCSRAGRSGRQRSHSPGDEGLRQSCCNRATVWVVASSALAPQPLIREAVYLHEIAQLTDADIARATGVARSTARAWLAHTRSPTGERAERLIELSALVERLARVMEPSYIAVWLRKPVPALEEHKPIDVIASGDYMRVAELVSALEEASFS
jgi:uncharacterized protein (DUF2384 family)